MAKDLIIIRSILTEKSSRLQSKSNQYTFEVHRKANRIEVAKAFKAMYGVEPASVNTMVMPAKAKNRNTRAGVIRGRVSAYKKAIVSLNEGDTIELFSSND
jgi:large subunit ribosomal protein L23